MARVLEDAEEYKASRHRGVQHSEENKSGNHEREGYFLVKILEGAKGGSCHILVARVRVDDGANHGEDENLGDGACPKSLGEVPNGCVY